MRIYNNKKTGNSRSFCMKLRQFYSLYRYLFFKGLYSFSMHANITFMNNDLTHFVHNHFSCTVQRRYVISCIHYDLFIVKSIIYTFLY